MSCAIILFLINLASLGFFLLRPVEQAWHENPLSIVAAAICIFIAPGWVIAQSKTRPIGALASLAQATMFSLIVTLALTILAFSFHLRIQTWCALVYTWNFATLLKLVARPTKMTLQRGECALLMMIAIVAAVLYRWGDDLSTVGWELALHFSYVRQYSSGLPLDHIVATPRPVDVEPPNLFFFWEFLLAGVSAMAKTDCLIAGLRMRFLVPFLGFPAFFFFVQHLTNSRLWALRTTYLVFAASIAQFFFLQHNPLSAITHDPMRGLTGFYGSIHHSDVAMEILLPLLMGCFFWFRRARTRFHFVVMALMFLVSFFWHPREYFQVAWIVVFAGITDWIFLRRKILPMIRSVYAPTFGFLLVLSLSLMVLSRNLTHGAKDHSREIEFKHKYVEKFLEEASTPKNWIKFELPFAFNLLEVRPEIQATEQKVQLYPYLIVLTLVGWGALLTRQRGVAWRWIFFMLTFFFSICFYLSQKLLMTLTYSEIMVTKIRIVYLLALALLGYGWGAFLGVFRMLLGTRVRGPWQPAVFAALALSLGYILVALKPPENSLRVAKLLSYGFLSLAVVWLALRNHHLRSIWRRILARSEMLDPEVTTLKIWLATFLLALVPLCARPAFDFWGKFGGHRLAIEPFLTTDANPMRFSPEFLQFLRAPEQVRSFWRVNARAPGDSPPMLGSFAPVYQTPLWGNVLEDKKYFDAAELNEDPIFNSRPVSEDVLEKIKQDLRSSRSQFVLFRGPSVERGQHLAQVFPQVFSIAFANPRASELVLQVVQAL